MRVLLVKMSSMGDVIHTLPAITDAMRAIPDIKFDWVLEENFAEIADMHPAVDRVIRIAIRRWRRAILQSRDEYAAFRRQLRERHYDLVIDAQGLLKSAFVTMQAHGPRGGYTAASAREPLASYAYGRKVTTPAGLHAIDKLRFLFAALLGYDRPGSEIDYGLQALSAASAGQAERAVMFLHGTTWPSKHWPLEYWEALARRVSADGYRIILPHGDDVEEARARQIARACEQTGAPVEVLGRLTIPGLMARMSTCSGAVSVDTGLGHLACALDLPLVGLYGATDPALTGFRGPRQTALVSDHLPCVPCLKRDCKYGIGEIEGVFPPCFAPLTPEKVWQELVARLSGRGAV